jgi:DNA-binding response OmpR family regulator
VLFLRHSSLIRVSPFLLRGTPVLVAEDDLLQAMDIGASLKEAGASVIGPVFDVNEAVALARLGLCGAAVLDFRFGSADAIPLGQELQRRRTPFVIHTGYDCRNMLPRQWLGCKVVQKPADMASLVHTVAALVRWRRLYARRKPLPPG